MDSIAAVRPLDSFRRHFVGPGEDERDRETEEHENNDEAHRPGRDLEDWKGRGRDLDEKPADRGVRHRDFVNIAPLQLGEEIAQIHGRGLIPVLRRERGDDFFEARIAAERVPDGEQF